MVPRVTAVKKPWKQRPLGRKRKADDGIKRGEACDLNKTCIPGEEDNHARGKFDTISDRRVV